LIGFRPPAGRFFVPLKGGTDVRAARQRQTHQPK
jgi:hypothetical protein